MIPHKRKHGEEVQQRTGKWPRQNNPHPHHDQSQQTSFLKQGSSQNQKSKTLHLLNDEFFKFVKNSQLDFSKKETLEKIREIFDQLKVVSAKYGNVGTKTNFIKNIYETVDRIKATQINSKNQKAIDEMEATLSHIATSLDQKFWSELFPPLDIEDKYSFSSWFTSAGFFISNLGKLFILPGLIQMAAHIKPFLLKFIQEFKLYGSKSVHEEGKIKYSHMFNCSLTIYGMGLLSFRGLDWNFEDDQIALVVNYIIAPIANGPSNSRDIFNCMHGLGNMSTQGAFEKLSSPFLNALRKSVKQAKNSQRLNNLEQLQFVFNAQVMTLINKLDESAEEHHIAGTIHSAGMMSQKRILVRYDDNAVTHLARIFKIFLNKTRKSAGIAKIIQGMGYLSYHFQHFYDGFNTDLEMLIEKFAKMNPLGMEIRDFLQGLGVLAKTRHLVKLSDQATANLFNLLGIAANRASSQQVLAPKVALALGKLVEMKVLSSLTDEVMEDLQKILASHMSLELYDDYGAGSLIKGFGSLSKVEGCSFKDSSLEHFSRLMKSYNQKYANAEIADIIAGVGLFGMAEFFPFDENSMDNLWGLVKKIADNLPKELEINRVFQGLSHLTTARVITHFDSDTFENIKKLFIVLSNSSSSDSEEIGMAMYGFSLISKSGILSRHRYDFSPDIDQLIENFSKLNLQAWDLTNSIDAMARLVVSGIYKRFSTKTLNIIRGFFENLVNAEYSERMATQLLRGLFNFATVNFEGLSMDRYQIYTTAILNQISKKDLSFMYIAQNLYICANFVESGYVRVDAEMSRVLQKLIKQLAINSNDIRQVCLALFSISCFISVNSVMFPRENIFSVVDALIFKIAKSKNIGMRNAFLLFHSLSRMIQAGWLTKSDILPIRDDLRRLLLGVTNVRDKIEINRTIRVLCSASLIASIDPEFIVLDEHKAACQKLFINIIKSRLNAIKVTDLITSIAYFGSTGFDIASSKIISRLLSQLKNYWPSCSEMINLNRSLQVLLNSSFDYAHKLAALIVESVSTNSPHPLDDFVAQLNQKIPLSAPMMIEDSIAAPVLPADDKKIAEELVIDEAIIEATTAQIHYRTLDISRDTGKGKRFYYINEDKDIERLERDENIIYKKAPNETKKATCPPILIAPVAVLPGRALGAYAADNFTVLKARKDGQVSLGAYQGERRQINTEELKKQGVYYTHTFDTLKPGEDAATCDLISGEKLRGWSAYMNSSILPNVTTKLKTIGKKRGTASSTHEKRDVVFSASSKFKKHKQCLIFYGETYFPNLEDEDHNDIQPLFIHETDNWQMPAEKYISAEKYYENTLFRANKTLLKTFGFKTDSLWALPKLCYLLLHDQVEEALQYIQSNADEENIGLEQLVYGLEKYNEEGLYHFSIADQQPQVNALAIACYFGQERVIHSLLKKEVYVDRLTLRDGYSAIHFLLIGPSSLETKLALLPTLIAAGVPVKFKNKYGKSAIDVCLEQLQNEKLAIALLDSDLGPELVSELLSSNDELDALSVEQSAGPCVLARCIANGWFELLSVIIKNANKKELNDYLMYESGIAGAILSHNNVDNLSIGLTALLDGLASKKMKLESDTRQHWVSCLNKRIVTEKVSDKLVVLVKKLEQLRVVVSFKNADEFIDGSIEDLLAEDLKKNDLVSNDNSYLDFDDVSSVSVIPSSANNNNAKDSFGSTAKMIGQFGKPSKQEKSPPVERKIKENTTQSVPKKMPPKKELCDDMQIEDRANSFS